MITIVINPAKKECSCFKDDQYLGNVKYARFEKYNDMETNEIKIVASIELEPDEPGTILITKTIAGNLSDGQKST